MLLLLATLILAPATHANTDEDKIGEIEAGQVKRSIDARLGVLCYSAQADGTSGITAISCFKYNGPDNKGFKGFDKSKVVGSVRIGQVRRFRDESAKVVCIAAQGNSSSAGVSISCLPY